MKNYKLSRNFGALIIILFLTTLANTKLINAKTINHEDQNEIYTFNQTTLNWTITEFISNDQSDLAYLPSLVVDSDNNVHIVWESVALGGTLAEHLISYKSWDALSKTWSTMEIISTETTSGAFTPCIAVDDNNNLHVVWADETNYASCGSDRDIFYKRWNVSTSTWSSTYVVSVGSSDYSHDPDISIDQSGKPHVVWVDGDDIFYSYWDEISSSWISATDISTTNFWDTDMPDMEIDITGNIHVVWEQMGGGDIDLHYVMWNISTSSWTTSSDLSIGIDYDALNPSIDSDSLGNVFTSWAGNADSSQWDIYCRKKDGSSGNWLAHEIISTETTDYLKNPSLCIDNLDNILLAWEDSSNYLLCGTDFDIFYKYWDSSNSSWTLTEVISTESSGHSTYPSLGVSKGGIVHISWQDGSDYLGAGFDEDIFYKTQLGPLNAPELAFIIPNPSETNTIYLDWNDIETATIYYVYRSTSYIWTIEGLDPIASVTSSEYSDTVPSSGYYYYVIVAGNLANNSTHSNCQYVEIISPELGVPELSFILPNPTETDVVSLVWDSIDSATEYYIYRSDSFIWSVEGLIPIAAELSTSYVDNLPDEGFYFYVIVATNGTRNSTISNCEYVQYKLPVLSEFVVVTSLLVGSCVILFVIMRTRKRMQK